MILAGLLFLLPVRIIFDAREAVAGPAAGACTVLLTLFWVCENVMTQGSGYSCHINVFLLRQRSSSLG